MTTRVAPYMRVPTCPWAIRGYFRRGNSSKQLSQIDSYVHQRLALFNSKKRQRSGPRWATVNTYAWYRTLGVHRLAGVIRSSVAATGVA
jgi:RNA-directed DNA polymerase